MIDPKHIKAPCDVFEEICRAEMYTGAEIFVDKIRMVVHHTPIMSKSLKQRMKP